MGRTSRDARMLVQGDYVRVDKEVQIPKYGTELRLAPGSVGRFIRRAWAPGEVVLLLGNWHIRVPRASVSFLRSSNGPLPFPWVDNVIQEAQRWNAITTR